MNIKALLAGAAYCALLFAPIAHAQDGGAAIPCELHVWPGSGLNSVYHGWFHGGIVNGAVSGREGYPEVPPDPIATTAQLPLLDQVQPQKLLASGGYRLVLHDNALTSAQIRTTAGRLGPSEPACYAELIVDDVFFQQDVVSGSFLKTLFRFRDFGSGQTPIRTFGTWIKTALTQFPPKTPANLEAALADLRRAYQANVREFMKALAKPAKKRN